MPKTLSTLPKTEKRYSFDWTDLTKEEIHERLREADRAVARGEYITLGEFHDWCNNNLTTWRKPCVATK